MAFDFAIHKFLDKHHLMDNLKIKNTHAGTGRLHVFCLHIEQILIALFQLVNNITILENDVINIIHYAHKSQTRRDLGINDINSKGKSAIRKNDNETEKS